MRTLPLNFMVCAALAGGLLVSAAAINRASAQNEIWFARYSFQGGVTETWPRIICHRQGEATMTKAQCPIVSATTKNCIEYQQTSADFHRDSVSLIEEGANVAAVIAQRHSAEYHDAAWDRLARLIGVE